MPNIHRKYGGSTIARTIACPPWANLAATIPKGGQGGGYNEAAELGTCKHDAMEWIFSDDRYPADALGKTFNDIVITQDMVDDDLTPAYNAVLDILDLHDVDHSEVMLEPFVEFTEGLAGGSIDLLAVSQDGKTMVVIDYKFGFRTVAAEKNAQMLFYAMCADFDPSTAAKMEKVERLALAIVQPSNPDHDYDLWETSIDALDDFERSAVNAIKTAEKGSGEYAAGDHCLYCPAMAVCPIKTGEAQKANKLPAPHVEMLEEWLPRLDDIEAWIKAVKGMATHALEQGQKIEGYKMVAKRPQRQWTDAEAVEAKIKAMRGISGGEQYDQKLKSPAQMEKLFKSKGVDFGKITDYIASVSSGSTMAKASDKRPEILPIKAFKDAMKRLE